LADQTARPDSIEQTSNLATLDRSHRDDRMPVDRRGKAETQLNRAPGFVANKSNNKTHIVRHNQPKAPARKRTDSLRQ
jgi:hypothetical protein